MVHYGGEGLHRAVVPMKKKYAHILLETVFQILVLHLPLLDGFVFHKHDVKYMYEGKVKSSWSSREPI